MEGNLSAGTMIPGASYGGIDLQGAIRVSHHQQHPHNLRGHHHQHPQQSSIGQPSIQEGFLLTMGGVQDCDHNISLENYSRGERGKHSMSDDDEPSYTEDAADSHNEVNRAKKGSPWQRVKWTDKMVRLLITAVSYIGEDAASECGAGGRRKFAVLQKKGKWKAVSKVMSERGYYVSPQQCEDKFNDLNKRYKRLNDVLGRGTSCQVVENPGLLDLMDHLSEKEKDDVRKILSSKHLFYEEMCSYHNGNRLHLPPDRALQHSLHLALRSRDDHENNDGKRHSQDDFDVDNQDAEKDDYDEDEENHALPLDSTGIYGISGGYAKKTKQGQSHEDHSFENPFNPQDSIRSSHSYPQISLADVNQMHPEGSKTAWLQKIRSHSLQLEEQKLQLEMEMLELERQRSKWLRFSKKKDRELDKLRMENERMKLENERMALELKQKEMGVEYN